MNTEATRTLLFGVFVAVGRPLTASQLIRLSAPLGLSATNVKSHLTRLVADGSLQRTGPRRLAQYRPSTDKAGVVDGILARLDAQPAERWDGRWLWLTVRLPHARGDRARLRDALWFDGFRPWGPETYLRPAWPRAWAIASARRHLSHRAGLCMEGRWIGRLELARVSEAYGVDALDREASRLARDIRRRHAALTSAARAFALRLHVGGQVARLVAHDPRLPPEMTRGRTGLRDLRRAYRRFERAVAVKAQAFIDASLRTGERE